MRALAHVARALGVGEHILLGRGEEGSGGRDKSSILADTLEALIGAVYVEHGVEVARAFVHRLVDPLMASSAALGAGLDWKTSLQELTAELTLGVPEYRISEEGPDHAKLFHAEVLVDGVIRGTGTGRSKKEAEQGAAQTAFEAIAGRGGPRRTAPRGGRRRGPRGLSPCPNSPRSRWSAAASRAGSRAPGSVPSRSCTRGRSAGTRPVLPTSLPAWPARPCATSSAAASSPGSSSTPARPCSLTSA